MSDCIHEDEPWPVKTAEMLNIQPQRIFSVKEPRVVHYCRSVSSCQRRDWHRACHPRPSPVSWHVEHTFLSPTFFSHLPLHFPLCLAHASLKLIFICLQFILIWRHDLYQRERPPSLSQIKAKISEFPSGLVWHDRLLILHYKDNVHSFLQTQVLVQEPNFLPQ